MKFECQKDCPSLCCKRPGLILLKPEDISRIGKAMSLSDEDVITNIAKSVTVKGKDHYVIEVTENRDCPFLVESEGCMIWDSKPEQCSGYVAHWPGLDIEKEAEFCSGIGKGGQVDTTPITGNPFLGS